MLFDLAIIGFGVIGVEALYGIKQSLIKRKIKKIIKIAVIEKDLNNIPGGVAYSKKNQNLAILTIHLDFLIKTLSNGLIKKEIRI